MRTCSLPCIKRHKKWAQCSGIRDPTVFVKRADLATPSGIDHDYNFLTGIERNIDNAERDAEERGVILDSADERELGWRQRGLSGPAKGEAKLKAAIEQSGAIISKAPLGMTRAKQNKTHWNKKKQTIVWTVEWVLNNGRSHIGVCPASIPLATVYTQQFESPPIPQKKRKRSLSPPLPPPPPPITSPASPLPPPPPSSTPSFINPPLFYYLLRPRTPSPTRVLLPLPSTATLATCLRDRPLLEFPTLYVLRYEPNKLPTGFITEETYVARNRLVREVSEEREWGEGEKEGSMVGGSGGGGGPDGEEGNGAANIDEGRLVEVLKRDLKT